MTQTREFHIGDILSVTDGCLVSPRHIDGVGDLLSWMTGEKAFTHQLPRLGDECAPSLRTQFPDLAALKVPTGLGSEAAVLAWLASQEPQYGTLRQVRRLDATDHTPIDPIAEYKMMKPDGIVVPVRLDAD